MSDQHPGSEGPDSFPEVIKSEDPSDLPEGLEAESSGADVEITTSMALEAAARVLEPEAANKQAIAESSAIIKGLSPKNFSQAILNRYQSSTDTTRLWKNNQVKMHRVVEVRGYFYFTRDNKPVHDIKTVLDIDIPPKDGTKPPTQDPHFGWEVYYDKKKDIGHVWVNATNLTGRPKKGDPALRTTFGGDEIQDLGKNEKMRWKFDYDYLEK